MLAPGMELMQVTVPQGVQIGQSFFIQTPSGQQMQVQALVPTGQAMQVQIPGVMPMQPGFAVGQPMMAFAHEGVTAFTPSIVQGYPAQVSAFAVPQVVGIPVDPAMFVTATLGQATDAVPMLDAQTAGIFGAVNRFKVKQRIAWMEAMSQGMCEQRNVYDIYDDVTGAPLCVAVPQSASRGAIRGLMSRSHASRVS